MKSLTIAVFLTLFATVTLAGDYTRDDFAYGYILETDNQGAIYSVNLPHDVYTTAALDNLGDIRIFNGENQIVPHELRYPAPQEDGVKSSTTLPFFPLYSGNEVNNSDFSMRVVTGSEGEIVSIRRSSDNAKDTPFAYLLDLEAVESYPVTLGLQWQNDGPGALLPVVLESSNDLVAWRREQKATLADLMFMDNHLQHAEIELSRKTGRYLRLFTEDNTVLPQLSAVRAVSSRRMENTDRRWLDRTATLHREEDKTFLLLEIDGRLPLEAVNIKFQQPNSLLKLRISSQNSQEIWRYHGEGLFYRLSSNGTEIHNEPISIPRSNVSALKLEVLEDGVGAALASTPVQLGYVPQEVLFIARGSGPYLLAYGNGRMVNSAPANNGSILHGLAGNGQQGLLRSATVKEKIILGGAELLSAPVQTPWKKIVLWLALLGGVATLAVMAWSLTRKMNK